MGAQQASSLTSANVTHQGSNSWMMLSKRITAKSLELNPANQARKSMVNDSKDCHPAGCVSPPERPPPPPPATEFGRPLPECEPPAFEDALCLHSEMEWCSAMFCVSGTGSGQERTSPQPSTKPTAVFPLWRLWLLATKSLSTRYRYLIYVVPQLL